MAKTRGFKLGHKIVKVFSWCIRRRTRRSTAAYQRLQPQSGSISKLFKWAHSLRRGAKTLISTKTNYSGHNNYMQVVGREEMAAEQLKVRKGHLAVYVANKEGDTCRVLVPVICFNHPLFGELLKEAEKVYGFEHQGGIQIPCRKSELENVQMRITAASGGGIWRRSRRS